jgi:ketosteroid isomerase-like protein
MVRQEDPMSNENVMEIRRLFDAVERRDLAGVLAAYAPDVVIHEAESLPYGGTYHGLDGAERHAYAYEETWAPFQEPEIRRLDAEVLDAGENVIVLWRQRGRTPDGTRAIDLPAVSVYQMRDGKITDSRMFQQDTAAIAQFLAEAGPPEATNEA